MPSPARRTAASPTSTFPLASQLEHLKSRDWNPILVREGRARWRGQRAYWLALAYASFLALVLWWSYSSWQRSDALATATPEEALSTVAMLGHNLFGVLCYSQVGAWLLLAPVLTSSSLSGERQKGLLDGLLMSRLSTMQIVRGKLLSALGLVALLQLAGAPVVAMCLLMGGVSPQEFVGAFAIQAATACCGAACGILSSASSRNNSDAASGAIGAVLAWLFVTGCAYTLLNVPSSPILKEIIVMAAWANPITATIHLLSPTARGGTELSVGAWTPFFALGASWFASVAGMALLSSWLLWQASRVLLRSPERFDVPPQSPPSTYRHEPAASSIVANETWQRERLHAPEERSGRRERCEVPILKSIRFGNAMMQREMSLLWRWHRLSDGEIGSMVMLAMFVGMFGLGALGAIFGSARGAQGIWWTILTLYGVAGVLLCAARPASSIAHEREGGVWQGLGLTMLSPLQVAGAKVLAPIVAALAYGAVAWVFLALAAWQGAMSPSVTIPSVLLMLLMWGQAASWSTFWGARARVPASALGWGMGGPAFAWAAAPLILSLLGLRLLGDSSKYLELLHPLPAFYGLESGASVGLNAILLSLVAQACVLALLFALAWRAVVRSQRVAGGSK